ncbi:hypothetical protein B8V81_3077 [Paenibacillus pasadenensis]|uniref:Uncharacterized protein n=1 Tax=Paenibacillus pasadenensis TaxID=217090 RepID=A0A2N5N2U6_9BACL|nr:hypothetical protein B8V81_3077 [Paenibacillus pasadenensis]
MTLIEGAALTKETEESSKMLPSRAETDLFMKLIHSNSFF